MSNSKARVITGKGSLFWVTHCGEGMLNYNEDGYNFVASIMYLKGSTEAKALEATCKALYEANTKKGLKKRGECFKYCNEYCRVKDDSVHFTEDTGTHIVFNFKTKVTSSNGKKSVITIKDYANNIVLLPEGTIGNNSLGKIIGTISYYASKKEDGISLFLSAIQVSKLVSYDSANFGEDDEGEAIPTKALLDSNTHLEEPKPEKHEDLNLEGVKEDDLLPL